MIKETELVNNYKEIREALLELFNCNEDQVDLWLNSSYALYTYSILHGAKTPMEMILKFKGDKVLENIKEIKNKL
jgi:hypothetical protein